MKKTLSKNMQRGIVDFRVPGMSSEELLIQKRNVRKRKKIASLQQGDIVEGEIVKLESNRIKISIDGIICFSDISDIYKEETLELKEGSFHKFKIIRKTINSNGEFSYDLCLSKSKKEKIKKNKNKNYKKNYIENKKATKHVENFTNSPFAEKLLALNKQKNPQP